MAKYTVVVARGLESEEYTNLTQKQAGRIAKKESKREWAKSVTVCFYRADDSQVVYLNPDGNHSPVGENWK